VAYQLALPLSWGIHDVFHASLLLPYKETTAHGPNFTRPPPDLIKGEEEYEVEAITNHRYHGRRRQLQYLIKWRGYPSSDNTWETAEDVHADDLVKEHHRRHPLESLKGKTNRGTKKLARTLQLFATAPSPTQKIVSWLLHGITPPTTACHYPLRTPTSSKDRPSASIVPLNPMSIPPNASTLSNMPTSAAIPTANTTPTPKRWVSRQVNRPLLIRSKKASSQPHKVGIIQARSSMLPPSSLSQERHISSKEAPTSFTPLPRHDDLCAHPYMLDHLPPPSSRPSAQPSPMSATWNIKDWLMKSRSSSTVRRKKAGNNSLNKSAGSKGCKTTSESYTLTSRQADTPPKQSSHASKSKAFPRPTPQRDPSPSLSPSVLTNQQSQRPCLPRPKHSPNLSLKKSLYNGRGRPF